MNYGIPQPNPLRMQSAQQPMQQGAPQQAGTGWPSVGQALGGIFSKDLLPMYLGMAMGGTKSDQAKLASQGAQSANELDLSRNQMAQQQSQFDASLAQQASQNSAMQQYRDAMLKLEQDRFAREGKPGMTALQQNIMGARQAVIDGLMTQEQADLYIQGQITPKQGFQLRTNPDGTTEFVMGGTGLPKAAEGGLAENAVAAERSLANFDAIAGSFKPEYLTYAGAAKGAVGGVADKLGMDDNQLTRFNAERSAFIQRIDQEFNQYRKLITGAAASPKELEDLKAAYLNGDIGPQEFASRLQGLRAIMAQEIQLDQNLRRQGIQPGTKRYDEAMSTVGATRGGYQDIKRYNPQTGNFE